MKNNFFSSLCFFIYNDVDSQTHYTAEPWMELAILKLFGGDISAASDFIDKNVINKLSKDSKKTFLISAGALANNVPDSEIDSNEKASEHIV